MGKALYCYPTLDCDLLKQLSIRSKYGFSFIDKNGNVKEIGHNITKKRIINLDRDTYYNKNIYDLYMEFNIDLYNGSLLYGPDGIAPTGSQLKLALEWYSQKNRVRNIIKSDEPILPFKDKQSYKLKCMFPKNTFDNTVNINIFLFLDSSVKPLLNSEIYLNNQVGALLGNIDEKELFLSGNGSLFPIYVKPSDNKHLWTMNIDYADPATDLLSEAISVTLNSKHKDYKYVDMEDDNYCESYIDEIISSVITVLLCQLNEDKQLDNLREDYEPGTILNFVKYYNQTLQLDIHGPCKISKSIRDYLTQNEV